MLTVNKSAAENGIWRHIKRKHKGKGVPVKNKSSVPYPRNQTAKEENIKTGQKVTTTGELDLIDVIYPIFKKYKDRNDKIEEMDNYFAKNSRIPLPSNLHPDVFNCHPDTTFDPPCGFRTYICVDCLTGPIDPVKLSDLRTLGPLAFKPRHVCEQEDLENLKRVAKKRQIDVIATWHELHKLSIQYLADIVHQMFGLHNPKPLWAFETHLRYSPWMEDYLPTNLGKIDKNHWASRAFIAKERKGTTIDNTELMDFLNLTRSTFAPFQAKIDGEARYFCLYIPCAMY